ncbi:MAG: hypothetical protein H7Y88_08805 [Phycisphaerales bacterium]|nr:hypothetical protein [Phycisphaerales bacterium]
MHVLSNTLLFPALIALLATVLAIPAAWAIRSAGGSSGVIAGGGRGVGPTWSLWFTLVASPLLLPNYLAYAGWGLLRAPRTPLGDWLAHQPEWTIVAFNKALAVAGLSLWAWPIAAMALAPGVSRLSQDVLDSLALDSVSRPARSLGLVRLITRPLTFAFGCVFLVMLGSVVPLHLAQIETAATDSWRRLSLSAGMGPALAAAWPVLLVACGAALLITRTIVRERSIDEPDAGVPARSARAAPILAAAIWALSIPAPLALFLYYVRPPGSAVGWLEALRQQSHAFWRDSGGAVVQSLAIAGSVGALAAVVAFGTWAACSLGDQGPAARLARGAATLLTLVLFFVGLSPGVLLGAALAHLTTRAPLWLADSSAPLIAAHLLRFGFVAALLGALAAVLEPRAQRDLRRLDRATGLRGWVTAAMLPRLPLVGAGAIVVALLSFHEIESTIFLLNPGAQSLSQQLLEQLHFARDQRLAAAAANLLVIGLALSMLAAVLLARSFRPGAPPSIGRGSAIPDQKQ